MKNTWEKQLDEAGVENYTSTDDGYYLVVVDVPNSTRDGQDAYEDACDDIRQDMIDALPGWTFEWAGSGNTDAHGDCTEDIRLYPPEGK